MFEIEHYWNNVKFRPIVKERGMWVHVAVIDSGCLLELVVVSKNRGESLKNMNWIKIVGRSPETNTPVQNIGLPQTIRKNLRLVDQNHSQMIYTHFQDGISVTKYKDPNLMGQFEYDEKATLPSIISQPTFEIVKL